MKHDDLNAPSIIEVAPEVGESSTFVNDERVPQKIIAQTAGYEISVTLKPGQRLHVRRLSDDCGGLKISFHDDEVAAREAADAPRRKPPYLRLIRS